ncbi:RHS repeat domain-containing protein [Bryobacter aggregatus]|uniref:RHS repeat domain-containing protein n=1 Tax=Bryobacter aggregatus TaxID=360054 RepID=UPI0004E129E3|nr:RHS repeat-associated core domain-containing protein [Bryobacter aggregatus]
MELIGSPGSVQGTYEYDGEGRRVKKTAGLETTVYVYDAMGQLIHEVGGTSEASGRNYLFQDHLGSTRLRVDANGTRLGWWDYAPFGEVLPGSLGSRSGVAGGAYEGARPKAMFTGKERDAETGLDYFGARYMSAAQGRFTSPDPTFLNILRVVNPQRWNMYGYALNNPLKYVDSDGNEAVAILYPTYQVGVRGNFTLPLGHAGVVMVAKDGSTHYFEYGRYLRLVQVGMSLKGPFGTLAPLLLCKGTHLERSRPNR